ncbi:MAG TPA: flagellar protein export ATPase FliI [Alphaproteobacteria bacterium]|nr:flagellar protein export ATPase FliI [Alphaproteobacteria bacterium]
MDTYTLIGKVLGIKGLLLEVKISHPDISLGTQCQILLSDRKIPGEVIGFFNTKTLVMPLGPLEGIGPQTSVRFMPSPSCIYPTNGWKGRVINACGLPLDDLGPLGNGGVPYRVKSPPPPSNKRGRVGGTIDVGVRSMNTFLTCCQGQRMGIFAGSGVGKSMLLSMLARFTHCDVCVIGLIGERGREVREFIEETLGEEGLKKSVVIVATSDEPPLVRRQAAHMTMSVAEYFRDQGQSVLLLMDSVTRLAMAQREIGLSAGEPPTTKGYTPSVFNELATVLERAGPGYEKTGGSITAFFTVLVDGDDHNEPIADAARGILDGHIVLDRSIAEKGQFPAIHILKSISRTVPKCHTKEQSEIVQQARKLLATYEEMADLIRLGAYRQGTDPKIDEAISKNEALSRFLSQHYQDSSSLEDSFSTLSQAIS